MKIKDLIEKLQEIYKQEGNLQIAVYDNEFNCCRLANDIIIKIPSKSYYEDEELESKFILIEE